MISGYQMVFEATVRLDSARHAVARALAASAEFTKAMESLGRAATMGRSAVDEFARLARVRQAGIPARKAVTEMRRNWRRFS